MSEPLSLWTVYSHPKDYPDDFVARKFLGDAPTAEHIKAPTLQELRRKLRDIAPGLACIQRHPTDEPQIVEVWL